MAHVRIFKHYFHLPYIYLGLAEFVVLYLCVYLGTWIRDGSLTGQELQAPAIALAALLTLSMVAMGVYPSRLREGYSGMMLRTAVAFFLIGALGLAVLFYLFPSLALTRGTLATSITLAFVAVTVLRWGVNRLIDDEDFKTRILVLGTGRKALKIATRLRRKTDQRGFRILGYVELAGTDNLVASNHVNTVILDEPLLHYCQRNDVHEIVVAVDERRRGDDGGGAFPIEELLECRLSGINVIDVLSFFEREVGKIQIDLLQPSWIVFSDGFSDSAVRHVAERVFDLLVATVLLLVIWPVMLLTILAIKIEDGFRHPVLYRQKRVGLNNCIFEVAKFRSMSVNAERDGRAVWAQQNDPRITHVGRFIRRARIDELPQLFNIFKGEMSFVGPRPERPEFVEELSRKIPYYKERHRVKPGIAGWAQLCYPYGASDDDALEKLQYDLYYMKNHSVLLDILIIVQTVDVILIGEGAR